MEQNRQRLLSNSEWLHWMVGTESEIWGKCQWDTPQGFELWNQSEVSNKQDQTPNFPLCSWNQLCRSEGGKEQMKMKIITDKSASDLNYLNIQLLIDWNVVRVGGNTPGNGVGNFLNRLWFSKTNRK